MADAPRSILAWLGGQHQGLSFAGGPSGEEIEYIRADVARADAELAVAEAIRRAAQEAHDWFYDPERDRVTDPRLGEAILALTPGDALAEMQRLRDERDSLRQSLDACIPAVEEAAIKRGQAEAERDAALEDLGRVILSLPTGMRLNGAVEGVKGLRADAQAAVALVVERAGVDTQVIAAAKDLGGEGQKNPEWAFIDYEANQMSFGRWAKCGPNPAPYVRLDLLLNADGLAAVDALRKELADTQTQLGDWIVRADGANVNAEKAEAELAAAQQREAGLLEAVDFLRTTIRANIVAKDGPHTVELPDGSVHSGPVADFLHELLPNIAEVLDRAALAHNGRGE